jgi:hypothetical protein
MERIKKYQPEIYGLLFFIMLLNVWYLSGIAIENKIVPDVYDVLIRFLVPFLSGFIGAYSAFKLREREEVSKETKADLFALHEAIFTLVRQLSAMTVLRKKLNKHRDDPIRVIKLRALQTFDYNLIKLDINSLTFLIMKGHKDLLLGLSMEQESFALTIDVLSTRSNYRINTFQPAFDELELELDDIKTTKDLREALGRGLYETLEVYTNNTYEAIDYSYESLQIRLSALQAVARELHPNSEFNEFTFSNPWD